jgi:tetratricopeptide (TPR) repeat protein
MSSIDDIQSLMANHERRLQKLREMQALTGYDTDLQILTEIEDIETTLAGLRAELERLQAGPAPVDPRLLRGHYFICYAPTDGADFAAALHRALAGAGVPTWFDQAHLDPSDPAPERQIKEALQTCAGLILLVSLDSGDETAGCSREWTQALSYQRPLVLMRLDPEADIPYRLTGYPLMGLSGAARRGVGDEFAAAVVQLRQHLDGLTSPAGRLKQVEAQLATAQADLRLAREAARRERIWADIEDLKKERDIWARVAADPQSAAERTRRSIAAGIERERQPTERPARLLRAKFINPPPLDVPVYFQDRFDETKRLGEFLQTPALRLLMVIGRGGIGKTALVARLLKHLERGELPDGIGRLAVDGIVYLSDVGARTLSFANLLADVLKLLPDQAARELEALYRDPQTGVTAKMAALLRQFPPRRADGSPAAPVIVLLDNFETRLDPTDAELEEALHALLNQPPHRLKVIITSRVPPSELLLVQPGRQVPLYLEEGLASPYAEALLRARDPDGKLGLKAASDAELELAVRHTRGYPRALEALAAALAADRDTSLSELLAAAETALPDNVVEVLVGEAYSRLAPAAQQVLQALAIYGRPVPLTAVDYLLEPRLPAVDSSPTLKRLVGMNFVSKEGGLYDLHPLDRVHALVHIPAGDEAESEVSTRSSLHRRAADFFKTTRKPRAEWKTPDDLAPQLAEFDLRCEAGDFDTAARVLTEIDFDYLLLWGQYRLMIDCHLRLQGKVEDTGLQSTSAGRFGMAYYSIGQVWQAKVYYQKALAIAREQKDKEGEGAWLGNLGTVYAALGETRRAIDTYEQALTIARDMGDRRGEGTHLGNLGNAYADLGETRRAVDYHNQALAIADEVGDRRNKGTCLGNLGLVYAEQGEIRRAIECYEQALAIDCDISDRGGEGAWLGNLGLAYADLGETRRAIDYCEQALAIARDIGDRREESIILANLGEAMVCLSRFDEAMPSYRQAIEVADKIGFPGVQNYARWGLAQAHLYTDDLPAARAALEAARGYNVSQNNHNVAALLGLVALRQGQAAPARAAFREAIALADDLLAKTPEYYSALYAKGLAWSGLAVCAVGAFPLTPSQRDGELAAAREAYRAALEANAGAGVVVRQRPLFEALAVADTTGVLAPLAGLWP